MLHSTARMTTIIHQLSSIQAAGVDGSGTIALGSNSVVPGALSVVRSSSSVVFVTSVSVVDVLGAVRVVNVVEPGVPVLAVPDTTDEEEDVSEPAGVGMVGSGTVVVLTGVGANVAPTGVGGSGVGATVEVGGAGEVGGDGVGANVDAVPTGTGVGAAVVVVVAAGVGGAGVGDGCDEQHENEIFKPMNERIKSTQFTKQHQS